MYTISQTNNGISQKSCSINYLFTFKTQKIYGPKNNFTTNRQSVELARISSSARRSAWRLEMTIFSTFCRIPVVVHLCFETNMC